MLKHIKAFLMAGFTLTLILIILTLSVNFAMSKVITGKGIVRVPNLIGMEFYNARQVCEKYSLLMDITGEEHHEFPKGFVISQSPSPDRSIYKHRIIEVTVSKGQKIVIVPNLAGFYFNDVEEILRTYELRLGDVSQHYSKEVPSGLVISSSPSPGTDVMAGKRINIVISIGPDPLETDEDISETDEEHLPSDQTYEENIF